MNPDFHSLPKIAAACGLALLMSFHAQADDSKVPAIKDIKSYCLDFNWAERGGFAEPGKWAEADPAETVAWHKTIGSNVIQTFCVSTNGYAWYKNGVVPEQPGLKHDFLCEVVKLGHAEGMRVMGYFCISANTRWGKENPELSYGTPSRYHIRKGIIPLDGILPKQLSELSGDSKSIAVLARAYRGKSIDSVWNGKTFVEADPPPFRIEFRSRKGWSDTARITHENGKSVITIRNPYQSGRGQLTRVGDQWPSSIVIHLLRKNPDTPGPTHFRIANGKLGAWICQEGATKAVAAKFEGGLDLKKPWSAEKFLNGGNPDPPIPLDGFEIRTTDEAVEIEVPKIITGSNPDTRSFEWCNGEKVR